MTPQGLNRLKLDEGLRLKAYPDPLTGDDPWTIGYGCTGSGISKGVTWTQKKANDEILNRVKTIEAQLTKKLSFFSSLSPVRQDVLVNLAYNIGVAGLMKWTHTLSDIGREDYKAAADAIRKNRTYFRQVGARCTRLADAVENDSW